MSAALQMPAFAPGMYRGMSYAEYDAIPAVRSSHLKGFERSALHARHAMLTEESTPALSIGQVVHAAILEPETLAARAAVAPPGPYRSNVAKDRYAAFVAENCDKTILKPEEWAEALQLARAARSHPLARALLEAPGVNEAVLVWTDEATGLLCKARVDRLCMFDDGGGLGPVSTLVELKTDRDASPRAFAASCVRYGYHLSAAHYLRGADALSPRARQHVTIVLEKDAPHAVAVYAYDDAFIQAGHAARDHALRAYANATESGVWPGYPSRITTLHAPAWLKTPDTDEETDLD